jgi:hypothetical protein
LLHWKVLGSSKYEIPVQEKKLFAHNLTKSQQIWMGDHGAKTPT